MILEPIIVSLQWWLLLVVWIKKGNVKLKVKLLNCLPGHIDEGEVNSEFDGSIFSGKFLWYEKTKPK